MSEDSAYYVVTPGGFAEEQIDKFFEKMVEVDQQWKDFASKHNSKNMYIGRNLSGLEFERSEVPLGWTSNSKLPANIYRPARLKVCMEAYKEFKALKSKPSGLDLANMLGIGAVFSGMRLSTPGFEKIGDTKVLILHPESKVPEGVTPIKTSEYWKMKEDEEPESDG